MQIFLGFVRVPLNPGKVSSSAARFWTSLDRFLRNWRKRGKNDGKTCEICEE